MFQRLIALAQTAWQRLFVMVVFVCAVSLAGLASAQQLIIQTPTGIQNVGSGQGERAIFFDAGTVAGAGTIDLVVEVLEATIDSTLQIVGGRPAVRATGPDEVYLRWSLYQAGTYDIATDSGGVPVVADIFIQINDVDGPNNERVFVPVCDGSVNFVRVDANATTDRSFGTVGSRPEIFSLIGDSNYNNQPESGLEINFAGLSSFEFGRTANNNFLIRVDNPTYSEALTLDFQCGDFVAPVAEDDADTGPFDTPVTLDILANDSAATANDNVPNNNTMGPSEYAQQAINLIPVAGATNIVTDADGDVTGFTVPGEGVWSVDDSTGLVTFTPEAGFVGAATPVNYNYENALDVTSNDATISVTIEPAPISPGGLPPFVCRSGFYEVISGQLSELDTSTGTYTPIGPVQAAYNATGYNILDNYIYGMLANNLIRVGSDGNIETVFPLGDGSSNGAMDFSGNLYYDSTATSLDVVNVATPGSQTIINFTGSAGGGVLDFAYYVEGGKEYMIGLDTGQLRIWNLTDGVASTNTVAGTDGGGYGGAWSAADGRVYFNNNGTGTIFAITDPLGSARVTSSFPAARSSSHDGMSCDLAPPPIPTPIPPVAVDDTASGLTPGAAETVDILGNDTDADGTIDPATVSFIPPAGAVGVVTDAEGDITGFDVPGEGSWAVDPVTGEVTFTPLPTFFDDPTPVDYTVDDDFGNISNPATITLDYTDPTPELTLVKSVASIADSNGNGVTDAGDTVTFAFTAQNTGETALADISVTDVGLTPITLTPEAGFDGDLAIGEGPVAVAEATYVLTPADVGAGMIENSATASGSPVETDPTTGEPIPGSPYLADDGSTLPDTTDASDAGTEPDVDADGNPVTVADPNGTDTDGTPGNDGDEPTLLNLTPPASELELVKSVASVVDTNGNGVTDAGDTVTFGFTAENTGSTALADVTVTDTGLSPITLTPDAGFDGDLAIGEGPVAIATATYVLTPADVGAGMIENTATGSGAPVATDAAGNPDPSTPLVDATGAPLAAITDASDAGTEPDVDADGNPVPVADPSGTDTDGTPGNDGDEPTLLNLTPPASGLVVIKSITALTDTNGSGALDAGDEVTFSFTVENTGQTALANVGITDVGLTPITVTPDAGFDGDLSIGEGPVVVASASYTLTDADVAAGGISNVATGSGDPVATLPNGDPDPASPLVDSAGDPLPPVTAGSDAGTGASIDPATGLPTPVADPSATETPDQTGATDTDPTNDPTALILPSPGMSVVKSVSDYADTNGNGFADEGDTLTYQFAVTNTGNTDLADIAITDALVGVVITGSPIATLAQGDTDTSVTATYVLAAADILAGAVENTAQGEGIAVDDDGNPIGDPLNPGSPLPVTDISDAGTDPAGDPVSNPDGTETPDAVGDTDGDPSNDPTVFAVPAAPLLELVKSVADIIDADGDNLPSVGDTVNYTFSVTNTGNVNLADVTITDVRGSVSGGPIDLDIGQSDTATFTFAYVITPSDVAAGALENTAIASGDAVDAAGDPILDPNTGTPLTALDTSDAGTDPALGPDGTPDVVADPAGTETGAPDGDPGNDPTVLAIPNPELTVVKFVTNAFDTNSDGLFGGEGDEIAYGFRVTNTGNVDLVGITITDALATMSGGPIDLAVGQGDSVTFTATYIVVAADLARGYVENTATATGDAVDADGAPLLGVTGAPITVTDTSDAGTDPDIAPIDDPNGTETPDGDGVTDGDPGNDPTVLSVPANATPRLSVIKSVADVVDNGDGMLGAGDTVLYSFVVTNTGNVDLADVVVTDPSATVSGGPISLALGATDMATFTATRVITAAEAASGAIENSAGATGGAVNSDGDPITEPGGGPQLAAEDTSDAGTEAEFGPSGTPQAISDPQGNETPDASGGTDTDPTNDPTTLFIPMPGLQVIKSVDVVNDTNGDGLFGGPNDVIDFTFVVTNTGNTDLVNITVTDATATMMGGPISLTAGASDVSTFTASYLVTDADFALGYVENTATGQGDVVGSDGNPLGNPVDPGTPLTVSDISDAGSDPAGAAVPNPDGTETPDGTGTTDGDPSNDPTVVSVPANPEPRLSVIKSVVAVFDTDEDAVVGGEDDELVYQFTIRNSGNVDLVNVTLDDAQLGGLIATIPTLDVGESVSLNHSYIISAADEAAGFIQNTATAMGEAVNSLGDPLRDASGAPITVTDDSDAGTDSARGPIDDPEFNETPDADGVTDGDPTNDPTVTTIPVAVPDTAITGTFYSDENDNGVLDDGDLPISGILVQLRDADGQIIATAVTDGLGFYSMEGFPVGTHNLEFVDPTTGEIVGRIDGLTFDRNTVFTEQDGSLVPPIQPETLIVAKTTPVTSVLVGASVPYVITVENPQAIPFDANIVDQLPPGFLYTPGSASIDGVAIEPAMAGQTLTWADIRVGAGQTVVLELVARVGSGAPTGDLVNTARTFDPASGASLSTPATAVVTRRPEAVFQCSDIIGKVFDDVNRNGYQDGPVQPDPNIITDQNYDPEKYDVPAPVGPITEPGLPGVRLMTTTGLIITTDEYGRFNVPCAALPAASGEMFTLKVDDTSLPTGYRMTTENPRNLRVTAGIMTEMNFGASIGRVVDIDLTASAFTSDHRPVAALADGLDGLLAQVSDTPSILRISYFTNGESGDVAQARLDALEALVRDKWAGIGTYRLIIERTVARLQ